MRTYRIGGLALVLLIAGALAGSARRPGTTARSSRSRASCPRASARPSIRTSRGPARRPRNSGTPRPRSPPAIRPRRTASRTSRPAAWACTSGTRRCTTRRSTSRSPRSSSTRRWAMVGAAERRRVRRAHRAVDVRSAADADGPAVQARQRPRHLVSARLDLEAEPVRPVRRLEPRREVPPMSPAPPGDQARRASRASQG